MTLQEEIELIRKALADHPAAAQIFEDILTDYTALRQDATQRDLEGAGRDPDNGDPL
jgi:hypothetical protein